MEMNCNLNKLAIFFFKLFVCIIEKSLKIDYNLLFLVRIPSYFPPGYLRIISSYIKGSLSNI